MAAALVVGGVLWLSRPPESLAAEIVTHVEGEPNSWQKTEPLSAEKLDAVLHKSGVNLGPGMLPVVYASSCWFRGHYVPHVVVTTKDGPVTVMILLHEQVNAAQQFNEDGLLGPVGARAHRQCCGVESHTHEPGKARCRSRARTAAAQRELLAARRSQGMASTVLPSRL